MSKIFESGNIFLHPADSRRMIQILSDYIDLTVDDISKIEQSTLWTYLAVASEIWHRVPGRGTIPVFPMPVATFATIKTTEA